MRYNEILLESRTNKLKTIARDITSGKVPNDVLHKLKGFMDKLMGIESDSAEDLDNTSDAELSDLLGVNDHDSHISELDLDDADDLDLDDEPTDTEDTDLEDLDQDKLNDTDLEDDELSDFDKLDNEFDIDNDDDHLKESLMDKYLASVGKGEEPKESIGPEDLNIYEQLKRVNPKDADMIWSFYNRTMIESVVNEIFEEKDLSASDAEKFNNMIIRSPGKLEDKVSLIKHIKDTGVIDLRKLITPGKGSIDKLFNYKSEIIDHIKHSLLNLKVSPKSTAVNVGAGEGFLMILGKNIIKLGKGDLNVLGKEVEVKAQGARLKGFGGKGTYGDGSKYYQKFNKDVIKIIGPKGKIYFEQQYGFKPDQPWHFSLSNLQALADVLAKSKANPAAVKTLFNDLLQFVFAKSTTAMRSRVTKTIKRNGSFDVDEFRKQWFLLTYEYYDLTSKDEKTGEGFAGILFINQPTFSYSFVTDVSQIEKDWDNYQLNPGLYNFTDLPSVAPKISFMKEVRIKRKKKKS